jgi:catechol 2,3-dioxygenase-like lactoylglutathione lyase family enzyme
MTDDLDFPAPDEGFVLTHFVVVSDQDRSRQWYERVLGAKTVNPRDPVIMKVANSWIILNVGGGPTEDKPDVVLDVPLRSDADQRVPERAGRGPPQGISGVEAGRRGVPHRTEGPGC